MRKVIWEEGFRRAVKRRTRKQPQLQAKIIQTLIDISQRSLHALAQNPQAAR